MKAIPKPTLNPKPFETSDLRHLHDQEEEYTQKDQDLKVLGWGFSFSFRDGV